MSDPTATGTRIEPDSHALPLPPLALMNLGGSSSEEEFEGGGVWWCHQGCRDWGRLKPSGRVLDVGCGAGRIARQLTGYLESSGSYEGLDVVEEVISWCDREISSRFPNFRFRHSDVHNRFYNDASRQPAREYEFPYPADSFDLVVLGSVFTHLLPPDLENYLKETARVLKPGGRCVASFFLSGEDIVRESGPFTLDFKFQCGGYRTTDLENPEAALSYERDYILGLYEGLGLDVVEPILFGAQDVVVTAKR